MRKIHIFAAFAAILALSASSLAYSQTKTDTTISGHVTDAKTGEHLPYITILLRGTNIGTQTSASGHYTLRNLPAGRGESYHRRGCGKCNKKPLFPKRGANTSECGRQQHLCKDRLPYPCGWACLPARCEGGE